ncbi:MAG: hypothetical protein AAF512_00805 [Pseudomonadota bacterium]
MSELEAQLAEKEYRLRADYTMLNGWSRFWRLDILSTRPALEDVSALPPPEQAKREREQRMIALQESYFVLHVIQAYLLPLIYGLLGACFYILRTLSVEIQTLCYKFESGIRYRLRVSMGAIAGLAIGWFSDALTGSYASLTQFALAFLAGYSVEVLFALMDRVVEAFSAPSIKNSNSLERR